MRNLALLSVVVLAACSSMHYIRRDAASYQHQTVDGLLKEWGPPTATREANEGTTEYEYGDDQGFTHRFNPKTHEMESTPNGCLTTFTVSADKEIVAWKSKGANCDDVLGVHPDEKAKP